MFKQKYKKLVLVFFASFQVAAMLVVGASTAEAVAPRSCAFDIAGRYTFMESQAECVDTLVNFLGESEDRSTPYFIATRVRISESPCRSDFRIRDVSEAQFNGFKSNTPAPSGADACPGTPPLEIGDVLTEGDGDFVDDKTDCKTEDLDGSNCSIVRYINIAINTLSVMVGIVVTIMIIIGGIQYTAAGADPNTVAKAKKQIFNAIFALVAYGLTYAFLQYIIPGGVL